MIMFKSLVSIFLAGILTENFLLSKFLGICPFLGVSKKLNTAVGMSAAVIFVMLISTAVTWPIYMYVLMPLGFDYLQTVVFIIIIAALVLFAGVRQKLETCDIPDFLKGLPITLIAASLLAVSFFGFQGLVDGMLG